MAADSTHKSLIFHLRFEEELDNEVILGGLLDSETWVWRRMEINRKGLESRLFPFFSYKPYTVI